MGEGEGNREEGKERGRMGRSRRSRNENHKWRHHWKWAEKREKADTLRANDDWSPSEEACEFDF